jgi:hypothetical protein
MKASKVGHSNEEKKYLFIAAITNQVSRKFDYAAVSLYTRVCVLLPREFRISKKKKIPSFLYKYLSIPSWFVPFSRVVGCRLHYFTSLYR